MRCLSAVMRITQAIGNAQEVKLEKTETMKRMMKSVLMSGKFRRPTSMLAMPRNAYPSIYVVINLVICRTLELCTSTMLTLSSALFT